MFIEDNTFSGPAGQTFQTIDTNYAGRFVFRFNSVAAMSVQVHSLQSWRGSRAWDDLGKLAPGSREARLAEIVRSAQAPHPMVLELLGAVRSETAPRTDKVRDRICVVWDLALDPAALRPFMEKLLESAVAEGRMEKPDVVHWETLEGSLESAALKADSRLLRVVDRRKVSYSIKTVGGFDRRTYHLETVYEFFSHGVALLPLPPEMVKELSNPKK